MLGQEFEQLAQTGRRVRDAAVNQQLALVVNQCDVMMVFLPVDPAVDAHESPLPRVIPDVQPGETDDALMEGLCGPTPDWSFVASARPTGLRFLRSSHAPPVAEVSGRTGSDHAMIES